MCANGITDIGLVRKANEDRLLIKKEMGLYVVCDGMGGHKGGDMASTLAVRSIKESMEYYDSYEPIKWLNDSIQKANEKIRSYSRANPEFFEMGTTVTAAVINKKDLFVAHVGDSRLYLIHNNTIRKITRDHTLAEQMLEDGLLNIEELRSSSYNHVLTRALGIDDDTIIDNVLEDVVPDDIILLCTDGLTDMLNDEEILSIINICGHDIERASRELIASALDKGGFDNVTVILIRV